MQNPGPASAADTVPYIQLAEKFITGAMGAPQFETEYITLFTSEEKLFSHEVAEPLNELFYAVDDYVGDPELRARAGGLDDDELLAQAKTSLAQLRELYRQSETGH